MEKEILENYKKAGKIASEVRTFGAKMIKSGALAFEIAEKIEEKIISLGGKPAFPVNISINDIAAHYSPVMNDDLKINETDYVKLDVGVHINGYIADTAITIRPAGKDKLIECSEKMLENAIKIIRPGITVGEIGEVVENTAKEFGFNPINNLMGHGLEKYNLHTGLTIPNIKTGSKKAIEEGQVIAIEPFATTGKGSVKDSQPALIYMWLADKPSRLAEARKILQWSKTDWSGLPFAKRWIQKRTIKVDIALKELINIKSLHPFYILKEVSGAPVSQSEHTIIVLDKPIITTL